MAIVGEVVSGARTIGTQSADHRRWHRHGPGQRHRPRPGGDHLAIGIGVEDPEGTGDADVLEDSHADSVGHLDGPSGSGPETFLRESAQRSASWCEILHGRRPDTAGGIRLWCRTHYVLDSLRDCDLLLHLEPSLHEQE